MVAGYTALGPVECEFLIGIFLGIKVGKDLKQIFPGNLIFLLALGAQTSDKTLSKHADE